MHNRLRELRRALNIQQGEFAGKIGILQQQLSKYERGENKPSADFFIKLIEKTNVNLNWLLTGNGSMFVSNETKQVPDAVEIIYYENPTLIETIKNPVITSIWMDRELIHNVWLKNEKNLRTLQMPGDTMDGGETPIKNKDMLIVDISDTNIQASGIFVYTTKNASLIFINGIKQSPDGSYRFYFRNSSYKEIHYTLDDLERLEFKVIGRVVKNITSGFC